MVDREQILEAIEAQAQLRGILADHIVDAAVGALRSQLDIASGDASGGVGPAQQRRQATVLFADLAGFTAMSEGLDAEVVAGLMNELWEGVDEAISRHGGRVDKHIGDAVMGVWGAESAREDDPERAVRAALDVRVAFEGFRVSHELDVDVRVGVNTGPVLYGEVGTAGELSVTGDAVNVASRVEHAAPHGTVLISHETYRHVVGVFDVRPQDPIDVKGKSQPLRTYVVERVKPRAFRLLSRGVEGVETRMVGRDAEFRVLQRAFVEALEAHQVRVVTVVGEAGAGKSRLLHEFTNWLELRPESIYYLKGRSVPDLQRVPRSLLRELFASRFEIYDDDSVADVAAKLRSNLRTLTAREADVVGHWLGFDLGESRAVQDLAGSAEFATVALGHMVRHLRWRLADSPSVMLLEDVHWADGDSLDAVRHVVDALDDVPMLVVCVARPSLLEQRPDWGSGPGHSTGLKLEPLALDDGRDLVHDILQFADDVPDQLVDLVIEHAGGNPFHIEELVKMLIDDGVILVDTDDGAWRIELDNLGQIAVPTTLTGVMQARLDGLGADERAALQHASVIGRTFWDDAVAALLSDTGPAATARRGLVPVLSAARDRELVRQHDRSVFSGCNEYVFKHALLRDATYETVLLRDRERLHAVAAAWLERRAGGRLGEHIGSLAEHLSRAGELGRAADLLDEAAARARATGALQAALDTYERSLGLRKAVGTDHGPEATAARIQLGRLYSNFGRYDDATAEYAVAEADGRQLADDLLVARALAGTAYTTLGRGAWEEAAVLVERVRPLAEQLGGEILGRFLVIQVGLLMDGPNGDLDEALQVSERALEVWRQLDDPASELDSINDMALICGRTDRPDEAERWYAEGLALARRIGDTSRETLILSNQAMHAHLAARSGDGDYEDVLQLYRASLDRYRGHGVEHATMLVNLAQAEIEAGQLEEGATHAREALRLAWRRRAPLEWTLCLVVFGQLAIADGRLDEGLANLGAVLAQHGTPILELEVREVLEFHGVDQDTAQRGMAAGASSDLAALVERLLAKAQAS